MTGADSRRMSNASSCIGRRVATGRISRKIPRGTKPAPPTAIVAYCRYFNIPVFVAADIEYQRSVNSTNMLYRFSHPLCVIRPTNAAQIRRVVSACARRDTEGSRIVIKNGGHSYSGSSTAVSTDTVLLDLQNLNTVKLDMTARTVTVGGGALWGHVYQTLVHGHHDGYVVNGGRCPNVGVSGFILGGGIGPFGRSLGMGCDALLQATIVLADGRVITVYKSDPPTSANGMLFWALCGAGSANFGVVVEMVLRVEKLQAAVAASADPSLPADDNRVVAGRYEWYPDEDEKHEFLKTMNYFYRTDWPESLTIDSSWFSTGNRENGRVAVRFLTYFDGGKAAFDAEIDDKIRLHGLAKKIKRRCLPEPSTRFLHETLANQWNVETMLGFPTNRSYRIFTSFMFKKDKNTVVNLTRIFHDELQAFGKLYTGMNATAQASMIHGGGQQSARGRGDTAFRWRDGDFYGYIMMEFGDKWLERDMRGFMQKFKIKLRPYSMAGKAQFVNFPDNELGKDSHEKAYYGNNRQKLQQVKKLFDPHNYFNWAQGISLPADDASSGERELDQTDTYSANFDNTVNDISDEQAAALNAAFDNTDAQEEAFSDGENVEEEALTDVRASRNWANDGMPVTNNWVGRHGGAYFDNVELEDDAIPAIFRQL